MQELSLLWCQVRICWYNHLTLSPTHQRRRREESCCQRVTWVTMSRSSYSRPSLSWRSSLCHWSSLPGMKLLEMSSGRLARNCVPPNSIHKVARCWRGVLTAISWQTILSGEWQAHAFKIEYLHQSDFRAAKVYDYCLSIMIQKCQDSVRISEVR